MHQQALNGYRGLLDTFNPFKTQHGEFRVALESSIAEEKLYLGKHEKRLQHLQQAQKGGEAGIIVCCREQMRQAEYKDATRTFMKDLVEHLRIIHELLTKIVQSAEN